MKKKQKKTKQALSTFVKLLRATETVSGRAHEHLATVRLSPSQFGVLEALYHLGPMCQKDLGGKILKSRGNMTMVITNLERRELVTRSKSEKDKRYYDIHLTTKGNILIAELFPEHEKIISRHMSILSAKELKTLGNLCRKFKILQDK